MKIALTLVFFSSMIHTRAVADTESIKVDVTGILKTDVVAIGGETTGTTITAKGVTWELETGKFEQQAKKLDGKSVRVRGELNRRAGVEIKQRWIVQVSALETSTKKTKPTLEAKTVRDGSTIEFSNSDTTQVIEVRCKRGIGSAKISRTGDLWPKHISVRLHLNGLESFKAQNNQFDLEWSVSSHGEKRTLMAKRQEGKEVAIKPGDPLHTEVKKIGRAYNISLPAELFEGNPREIALRWIDFYR